MPATITHFKGEWGFLSNFYGHSFLWGDFLVPTAEHAFQMEKTIDPAFRMGVFTAPTPSAAKKLGRKVPLRDNWDNIKDGIMLNILRAKFCDPILRAKLLTTEDCFLIEGNSWGDTYWGQSPVGTGLNKLGLLLMKVRDEINNG